MVSVCATGVCGDGRAGEVQRFLGEPRRFSSLWGRDGRSDEGAAELDVARQGRARPSQIGLPAGARSLTGEGRQQRARQQGY